ncbi:phosphotransferase enzyme family protein [Metabacillus sp. 113a]|uniref:phosphotransferase enzyme family protein n=1 Tax=Metabacillus sp. 113a TaxID=3404706 RepID=UPI003CF3C40F
MKSKAYWQSDMEKAVEEQFTDEVIETSARFFGVELSILKKLGEAENYVFEICYDGAPAILRITHSSHRSLEQIEGELDFVAFLYKEGVRVCRPISSNGKRICIHSCSDGSAFYSCLFEKAPGERVVPDGPEWKSDLFHEWGKTISLLHLAADQLKKSSAAPARPEWDEEELLDIERFKQRPGNAVLQQKERLLQMLRSLPRHDFGLIHSDLHTGNFHWHDRALHLFDFDDSSYHWFASDLAIPLYYYAWGLERKGENSFEDKCSCFFHELIKGYETKRCYSSEMATSIPIFLKLRDFVLYVYFHKKYDEAKWDKAMKEVVGNLQRRIESNLPIVSIGGSFD